MYKGDVFVAKEYAYLHYNHRENFIFPPFNRDNIKGHSQFTKIIRSEGFHIGDSNASILYFIGTRDHLIV